VIAGTGANSTAEALENTVKAEKWGVDACLLVVPYYNKPTQEGLYRHFKTIAENTKLPCIIQCSIQNGYQHVGRDRYQVECHP